METHYYIGIDLDDDNAIVSYFQLNMSEPETVSTVAGSEIFQIPMIVTKKKGIGQWFIGDDAKRLALKQGEGEVDRLLSRSLGDEIVCIEEQKYTAKELLTLYIKKLIYLASRLGNPMLPDKLVISLERLSREATSLFLGMAGALGLSTEQVTLIDRRESFYYFIYSQKSDLWLHDVCLFDYRGDSIRCRMAKRRANTFPQLIAITEEIRPIADTQKDEMFLQVAKEQMQGNIVSSAYLVGDGFDGNWMKESLNYVCKGRRVFMGKNLYSKGACYAAVVKEEKMDWTFIYMGDNEMKVNVSLKVRNKGKMEFYTLINAGDNWYETIGECEVILDGTPEIDFWLQMPGSREAKVQKIELADLPKRPPKTTRLRIVAKPVSDREVQIQMKDMGFGEIFKGSDKTWDYTMAL